MRRIVLASLSVLAAVQAVPGAAQDGEDPSGTAVAEATEESDSPDGMAALAGLFPVEPLTSEQQARLPQARAVVEKIVPPGAMGEIMGSMFDGFLDPLLAMAEAGSTGDAARMLGRDPEELDLSEEQAREVALLIDPALDDRNARMKEALPRIMSRAMSAMEPAMRDAMTQVYAVYFDATELSDIDTFFSTPSGAAYARKSLSMSTDPRFLSSYMTALPEMMASLASMEEEMAALMADLPEQRSYEDLDRAQRDRLAALTGLSQSEIEEGMTVAQMAEDNDAEDFDEHDWSEE